MELPKVTHTWRKPPCAWLTGFMHMLADSQEVADVHYPDTCIEAVHIMNTLIMQVLARGVTVHEQQGVGMASEQLKEQPAVPDPESSTETGHDAYHADNVPEEMSLPAAPGLSTSKVWSGWQAIPGFAQQAAPLIASVSSPVERLSVCYAWVPKVMTMTLRRLSTQVTAADRGSIRQQIALAATKLLNAPETHGPSLRFLVQLSASDDDKVLDLAHFIHRGNSQCCAQGRGCCPCLLLASFLSSFMCGAWPSHCHARHLCYLGFRVQLHYCQAGLDLQAPNFQFWWPRVLHSMCIDSSSAAHCSLTQLGHSYYSDTSWCVLCADRWSGHAVPGGSLQGHSARLQGQAADGQGKGHVRFQRCSAAQRPGGPVAHLLPGMADLSD